MSGKYPARVGVTDWIMHGGVNDDPSINGGDCRGRLLDAPYIDHLPLEEKCLPAALKEGGYQTWHVGKWHIGLEPFYPEHHGFDINIGGCKVGSPGGGGYFAPWSTIPALKDAPVPEGTYLTDYLTDETIRLLRERDKEKPFYLNLWYYSVHTPIQAKEDKIKKYEKKAKAMGRKPEDAMVEGDFFPGDHKKDLHIQRRIIQSDPTYAAMIESLDEGVGRVLDELEAQGLTDNTLVVFTSDNGGLATAEGSPTCNLPLAEGKGWMYEGGTREPFLVCWPGKVRPGSLCDTPVTTPDLYPTFLEAAGLPLLPEQHVDGESLLPLLKEKEKFCLDRDAIFWHYPHYGNQGGTPGSSVRMGDWKLIEFFEDDRVELYNLALDPGETKDLAFHIPGKTKELTSILSAWQNDVGAKIPEINPDFSPWSADHKARGFRPFD